MIRFFFFHSCKQPGSAFLFPHISNATTRYHTKTPSMHTLTLRPLTSPRVVFLLHSALTLMTCMKAHKLFWMSGFFFIYIVLIDSASLSLFFCL